VPYSVWRFVGKKQIRGPFYSTVVAQASPAGLSPSPHSSLPLPGHEVTSPSWWLSQPICVVVMEKLVLGGCGRNNLCFFPFPPSNITPSPNTYTHPSSSDTLLQLLGRLVHSFTRFTRGNLLTKKFGVFFPTRITRAVYQSFSCFLHYRSTLILYSTSHERHPATSEGASSNSKTPSGTYIKHGSGIQGRAMGDGHSRDGVICPA
jgi:hypothetical protein